MIKKIFRKIFKKDKIKTEELDNNTKQQERVIKNVEIKQAYVDREISLFKLVDLACCYNPACQNFMRRRPDLFEDFDDLEIPSDRLAKPEAMLEHYYYVKEWNKKDQCFYGSVYTLEELRHKYYELFVQIIDNYGICYNNCNQPRGGEK